MIIDKETGHLMKDLIADGDSVIAAKGGRGGRGNVHYKSSTRQAPNFAEAGGPAKTREVILELKLIADVGLLGFPNVGKSTLLSVCTNSKPKIASYHFTTIDPNLGVVYLHDTNNRGAFQRERRTLSHGCVRVEKPFELACFLLPEADDWMIDRLRLSMDIKPETERGQKYLEEHPDAPSPLKLMTYQEVEPKVPVYIIYYTAYPNPETGIVELWPDIYKFDEVIAKEMGSFLLKK